MLPAWLKLMLFTRGTNSNCPEGVFLVAMAMAVPVGKKEKCAPRFRLNKHCSDLNLLQHNLTRLGRDKFIYGLLINHQSLGGLLCEYLSV